jgi:hypothetical protein
MMGSRARAVRPEAMFAMLAGAALLVVAAAILLSLRLLAPSPEARLFDAGNAVSLDLLARATRL